MTEAKKNGQFGYIIKEELVVEDRRLSRTKATLRQEKKTDSYRSDPRETTSSATTTTMTTQSCNDQTTDISVTRPP